MVYRGKLSKSCLGCRRRKLICDLDPEGCAQCRRAALTCTGYRDTEALRIKDESAVVRRKAEERQRVRAQPPVLLQLDLDLCHQARIIFNYSYVAGAAKPYQFLQHYYGESSEAQHLQVSIDAVALACLNYQKNSVGARAEARRKYIHALQSTQKAILDPTLAVKDSTLLAILLLDLYEKITNQKPALESAWAVHLEGALSLVRLRGHEQFRNPESLKILVRLTTNMLISCVAGDRPVPTDLARLRSTVSASFLEPSDPKWRESQLMISYAQLKHRIKQGTIDEDDILPIAKQLDDQFKTLSGDINESWQYRIVEIPEREKSPHHFESYHHEYPLEQMAQMWNTLRLTRILLNELVCDCRAERVQRGQTSQSTQTTSLNTAEHVILRTMRSEICASVPQYICDSSGPTFANDSNPRAEQLHAHHINTAQATQHLPCYRLIFPLYIAAQSVWASQALKTYAIEQLHFISDYHGIRNAAKVANILENEEILDPWHVYNMLGSYAFVC